MQMIRNMKREFALHTVVGGYALSCNAKLFQTPAGNDFIVPTQVLGKALIAEWMMQNDKINPTTMPLNQLAATALDIVARDRTAVIDHIMAYATTELLCHRADIPAELSVRQATIWQPFLDWCTVQFDAPLLTTVGVIPVEQPTDSLRALCNHVSHYNNFALCGLRHVVEVTGSLVLGLATAEQHAGVEGVLAAAELDCDFQIEKWGTDPASETRRSKCANEIADCARWFSLLVTDGQS